MALAFVTLAYVYATGELAECPDDCSCQLTSFDSHLTVDCSHVLPDVDEQQLSHALESMLSADHFVEHLTSLSITNTPLTRVPASVCNLVNLTSLNLDHNKLTELPDNCFTKLTKLRSITAAYNAITGLQDGLFDGLQNLVTIKLSHNQIAFIGLRLFSNSSDLTRVRSVDLGYNKLTSLEPWWYHRCIHGCGTSPVTITLQHNLISNFTNELNFRFRCSMKRPCGHLDLYMNRIAHIMDILTGWNIISESFITGYLCVRNLKGAYPQMDFNLAGYAYICDCTDYPMYKMVKMFQNTGILNNVYCAYPYFYSDFLLPVLARTIPLIDFVCEMSERCPSSCRCVYRPENITLHVNCSAANLSSLPLDLPPLPNRHVKYKLDFSNNKLLRRLEHRPYFVNTSILDVRNCSLTELSMELLINVSRFGLVNIRGNMLESFPRQANTLNISARLLIGNNPWRCSCDNSWMIGWLQSLSHQISDEGDIICRSPSRMYGRNVLKSTVEDFCVDPVKQSLIIILSSLILLAAVVAFPVISVLLCYKLRLRIYKKWKFHPFDRDECDGEDMDYDVFLCCSSLDDDPHGRRILDQIEANSYRVCYHERDFTPGHLILDNMAQSIQCSKRTVCLLSTNFLNR